jgi:hypothetical protein
MSAVHPKATLRPLRVANRSFVNTSRAAVVYLVRGCARRGVGKLNSRCRNCQNPPPLGSNFAAPLPSNASVGRQQEQANA